MNQINFSSNQRQPGKLVMIISNLHGDIEYFACVNERLQGMPKAIRSERGILRGHYRPRNALPPANSCILNQQNMENPPDTSFQEVTLQETNATNDSSFQPIEDDLTGFSTPFHFSTSVDITVPLLPQSDQFFNDQRQYGLFFEDEFKS